jgi:hypothetical protein
MKLVKVLALADQLIPEESKRVCWVGFLLAMYRYGGDYFFATSKFYRTCWGMPFYGHPLLGTPPHVFAEGINFHICH